MIIKRIDAHTDLGRLNFLPVWRPRLDPVIPVPLLSLFDAEDDRISFGDAGFNLGDTAFLVGSWSVNILVLVYLVVDDVLDVKVLEFDVEIALGLLSRFSGIVAS